MKREIIIKLFIAAVAIFIFTPLSDLIFKKNTLKQSPKEKITNKKHISTSKERETGSEIEYSKG